MDFTIICPNCGARLRLFDSQVKQRKGAVRCTRCGCRIPYDLSQSRPQRTGFWPETEVPFKPGAQKKFLSLAKARQKNPDFQLRPLAESDARRLRETPPAPDAPRVPPAFDRSQNAFQKFDMKTGRLLEGPSPLSQSVPVMPGSEAAKPAKKQAPRTLPRREARPARKGPSPQHAVSREAIRAVRPAARAPLRTAGPLARLRAFFLRLFGK